MDNGFVAVFKLASVAFTVKLDVPFTVGVPAITPVVLVNVSPVGRLPLEIDHV